LKINLEENCSACEGSGYVEPSKNTEFFEVEECGNCEGKGQIPTFLGIELLEFIRKYL